MEREINALKQNNTWRLVPHPQPDPNDTVTRIIMRGLWRFHIKTQNSIVISFKSRFCADGSKVQDDPNDIYTPAARSSSMKLSLPLPVYMM